MNDKQLVYINVREDCSFPFEIDNSIKDNDVQSLDVHGNKMQQMTIDCGNILDVLISYNKTKETLHQFDTWSRYTCNSDTLWKIHEKFLEYLDIRHEENLK